MPLCACTNVAVDDSATDENSVYSAREATTTTPHDNRRVVAVDNNNNSTGDNNNNSSNHAESAVTTYGHDTSSAAAAESVAVAAEVGLWQPGLPLRVLYVTWNMAGRRPSMRQVHAHCVRDQVAHIVVVATQENGPYVGSNKAQRRWLRALTRRCLRRRYRVVGCVHQWALHLAVFARTRDVAPYISHVHRARVSTGMLHSLCGNKGAVAVAFAVSMQSCAATAATSAVAAAATASPALSPLSKATSNPLTSSCERRRDDTSGAGGGDDACAATSKAAETAAAPADVSLSSPCVQQQQQQQQHASPSSPLLLASSSSSPAATHMTVLCVNAHLPAHQHAVAHRSRGYQRIVRHLRVGLRGRYASWFAHMLNGSTAATTAAAANNNNNNNNNTTLHNENVCARHDSRRHRRHPRSRCRLRLHSRSSSSRSSRARRHTATTTTTKTATTTTTTTVHRDAASVGGCGCGCGDSQRRKRRHRHVRRAAATREEEPSQHDISDNVHGIARQASLSSSQQQQRGVRDNNNEDVDARCIQRHDSVSSDSASHASDSDSDSEVSLLHLPSLFPFFRRDNATSRAATATAPRRRSNGEGAQNAQDVTEQFDITFFGGDLNYRLNGDRVAIERTVAQYPHTREALLRSDQLLLEQVHDKAFDGFREAKLIFRPTYKYALQRGTHVTQDGYTSTLPLHKQRPPAYCDRVLYKKRHASAARHVAIRAYTDVPGVRTSDHRPVMAVVDVSTRACVCDAIVRT